MIPDIQQHEVELRDLCRRFRVLRLEVVGSAATVHFVPGDSDLDFLVEFASPGPVGDADRYFGLLESLEALFGRPVDLVVASTIKNPYFRESLSSTRTLFSGRKEPIKVGLLKAMLRKAGPAEEEFTGLLEGGK